MSRVLLSIIVIARNEQDHIGKCLEAIISQSSNVPFKIEIIVVDNASSDRTRTIIQSFPVQYFYEKNAGSSYARNRGWRESKGDLLLFIDGDCIVQRSLLEKVFNCFDDPIIDACCCNVHHDSGSKAISKFTNENVQRAISFGHKYAHTLFLTMNGACMALRRSVLDELGGFSIQYFSGQDAEISLRLIYENKQIFFIHDACVHHLTHNSVARILRSQCSRRKYVRMLMKAWDQVFLSFNIDRVKDVPLSLPGCRRFFKQARDPIGSLSFQDKVLFFFLVMEDFFKWRIDLPLTLFLHRSFRHRRKTSIPEAKIDRKIFLFNGNGFSLRPNVKFKFRNDKLVFHRPNIKDLFYVEGVGKDFLKAFFLNEKSDAIINALSSSYNVERCVLLQDLQQFLEELIENQILYLREPG